MLTIGAVLLILFIFIGLYNLSKFNQEDREFKRVAKRSEQKRIADAKRLGLRPGWWRRFWRGDRTYGDELQRWSKTPEGRAYLDTK
jgi:hypothetical protein